MKKIIAIAMALVMMMAIAVPAFATDITKDTAQSNQATVATTTSDADATYTVTFPASTTIAWGDTAAKDVAYTVTSQLPIGATLKVSVAADNNGKMTSTNAPDYELVYTLTGDAEATFEEINNGAKASDVGGTDATVAIADFSQAVPDVYQGTLTYTVVYDDGSATA